MPTIEITQEALEALKSSKFETASDAILAAMPKKRGSRKPESWKLFFGTYPANKKGGTDASAWKAAKREGLTEDDFKLMLDDVINRAKLMPSWGTTYAQGITRYISERIWLTPITPEVNNYGQNQPRISHAQRSTNDTEQLLAYAQSIENGHGPMGANGAALPQPVDCIGGPSNGEWTAFEEFQLVAEEDGTVIDRRVCKGDGAL